MCGICGIIDRRGTFPLTENLIEEMTKKLAHRGPDARGIKLFDSGTLPRAGLGHARLSVIDTSQCGHEPMSNEEGNIWLVYNGEIYNFLQLRPELEGKGHRFSSRTDAEVVIHAYEEYGENCLQRFRGDFAFAIWDNRNKTLFCARDRVGVKPFYYYHRDGRFIFGSELKAILAAPGVDRSLDYHALNDFLTYEFIPFPRTLFTGIRKLPPAHYCVLHNDTLRIFPYWEVRYHPVERPEEEIAEELVEQLRESVKMRLVSDVPLGAFLSGGLDSSTIVGLMSQVASGRVKTFSIGFEDKSYNELSYAQCVAGAFGTRHREFIIKPRAVELFDTLMYHMDDPIADFSIFPTYLVSKMARDYVTVALSGDGGDEVFAGYDTYLADRLASRLHGTAEFLGWSPVARLIAALPPSPKKKGLLNRLKRFSEGCTRPEELRQYRWMTFLSEHEKGRLYTPELQEQLRGETAYAPILRHFERVADADELNRQLYVDLKTYLIDDGAVKIDRMSMARSLEVRVPMLDHKLIEFMATVPPRLKLKGLTTKYILRRAFGNMLPDMILNRGKEGFSIPIKRWLNNELNPLMRELLSPDSLTQRGLFQPAAVNRLMKEHMAGRENHSHRLWALMVSEKWARMFLDGAVV